MIHSSLNLDFIVYSFQIIGVFNISNKLFVTLDLEMRSHTYKWRAIETQKSV